MVQYRRNFQKGGTYFFTVTLRDRKSDFLIKYYAEFSAAIKQVKQNKPFNVLAYVVLPEHCHFIWRLSESDKDYSGRWREIKKAFTKKLVDCGVCLKKNHNNEYALWQRRFWEHTIVDEDGFENHVNYIHYNPVKHEVVGAVNEWPYSSFHHYVAKSVIAKDWAGFKENELMRYGE